MKLVISLATRGRPQQLLDTINRSTVNLVLPNTVFIVQADEDDQATIDALAKAPLDSRVRVDVRPREDTIAAKWNRALCEPADVYLVVGDDDPYVTPGYDGEILKAAEHFPDGIGMVYGRMANASFSGSVAPTARLAEKMGYLQPEHFPYWFCDHWTDDVARIIGRVSFAEIRTDQSKAGKTQELREPAWWATWFDAAYLIRRNIAHAIINDPEFKTPEWHKNILRGHHPLIEFRSRWVNENVRASAKQLEGWSGLTLKDPRYQRVREAAVAMVPLLLNELSKEPNAPGVMNGVTRAQEVLAFQQALIPPTNVVSLKQAFV